MANSSPAVEAEVVSSLGGDELIEMLFAGEDIPAGHRWVPVPQVTLIGDAAHLAPPNGEGANTAMQDGAELGRAIAAHPDDAEVALAAYEQATFPRAAEAGDEDTYDLMLGDDAPHSWVAMMQNQRVTSRPVRSAASYRVGPGRLPPAAPSANASSEAAV
jgi:hypothetical protein